MGGEKCDRMSACAHSARKIVEFIRHQGLPHRMNKTVIGTIEEANGEANWEANGEANGEEGEDEQDEESVDAVLKILNHDALLLGRQRCNTLALQTVHEAIRATLADQRTSENDMVLEYLECAEKELLSKRFQGPSYDTAEHVHLLSLKHMGRGVDYLVLQMAQRRTQTKLTRVP